MKQIIFIAIGSVLISTTAHAQALRKAVPKAIRAATQDLLSDEAMHRYLPINRATPAGNVMIALEQQVYREQAHTQAQLVDFNTHAIRPQKADRSWLEQQKRNYKAWQLKRQHRQAVALREQIAALPQLLPQEAFTTRSFEELIPVGETIPQVPFIEQAGTLYRGLGLETDGNAIKHILDQGLLVQDAGDYSNMLLVSLMTTPQDAAAASASKFTNLTQSPSTALHYAQKNGKRDADKVLPVIVAVRGEIEYGKVVRVQHDIPTGNIQETIILLQINGTPTWCHVENTEDGFLVIPYERK